MGVHYLKNVILDRVRVLKFVNKGRRVFLANGPSQCISPFILQGGSKIKQKIIKSSDIQIPFSFGELLPGKG